MRSGPALEWRTEEAEKVFGGAQINLPTSSGEKTKKMQKNVFILTVYLFSGDKSRLGRIFIAWRGTAKSNGADLAFCLKFRGEEQKK